MSRTVNHTTNVVRTQKAQFKKEKDQVITVSKRKPVRGGDVFYEGVLYREGIADHSFDYKRVANHSVDHEEVANKQHTDTPDSANCVRCGVNVSCLEQKVQQVFTFSEPASLSEPVNLRDNYRTGPIRQMCLVPYIDSYGKSRPVACITAKKFEEWKEFCIHRDVFDETNNK